MKRIIVLALLALAAIPALAQTACAPPAQAKPNFSGNGPGAGGSYPIAAGATLPVVWTPSPTPGCTTYYTINGQTPTTASPVYTGQTIQLAQTTTILMIAMGPGATSSQQQGGLWAITGGGTPPPVAGKAVNLTCTPSTGSTATSPGTTSIYRAPSGTTNYTLLASLLPPGCTYTDSATVGNQSYSYYAVAVIGGQTSVASNSATVLVPPAVTAPTTPTVAVSFAPTTIDNATAVTATITVSGSPSPTGIVTLASGAFSSAAATLANGSASIVIPANSLDVGTLSFAATYTPDTAGASNYTSATGIGSLVVTPVPPSAVSGTVIQ